MERMLIYKIVLSICITGLFSCQFNNKSEEINNNNNDLIGKWKLEQVIYYTQDSFGNISNPVINSVHKDNFYEFTEENQLFYTDKKGHLKSANYYKKDNYLIIENEILGNKLQSITENELILIKNFKKTNNANLKTNDSEYVYSTFILKRIN